MQGVMIQDRHFYPATSDGEHEICPELRVGRGWSVPGDSFALDHRGDADVVQTLERYDRQDQRTHVIRHDL
jgi:hypothetical protein